MPDTPFIPLARTVEVTVPADAAPQLLPEYLAASYNYLDLPQWLEQIERGNLFVNGVCAGRDTAVAPGDTVFFQARELVEQAVCWDIGVIAETPDYIIVNKPGNLPCHPAGRFFNHTLWAWFRQSRHLDSIHFVNRLDRETSGIVLVGKNPRFAAEAARYLHARSGAACKEYLVMVHGCVKWKTHFANGFLMPDSRSAVRKKKCFVPVCNGGDSDVIELPGDPEAVTALTDFEREGSYRCADERFVPDENGGFTLLRARLYTGRTHQIRATLCSLGYPVAGDKLYGLDERLFLKFASSALTPDDWGRLLMPHQALHACYLSIPALGIEACAPCPWIAG